MGVFEEYEAENRRHNMCKVIHDFFIFDYRGLFSKDISLNYEATSEQPLIFFNCLDKDKFSFKVHDLQLKEDAIFWHGVAQRDKKIKFKGFINSLYDIGFGGLRGNLNVEKDYQELGIYVRKGEVYQLQTKEQKDEFRLLLSNFTRSINPVLNKPIKKELS
ncbi:hypothetical protein CMI39_01775 [Candidatus Pacearchaeota archaeon]|jgi:hypothetical protein|nr:hypothetical protein [Candidatus Pacearchaeota archaeon]|tara:strand:+ start:2360 stop:2842 length:483 start_codon:yes stop_codon:yes gene_type:complete